jgi:patatin-related protein
MSESVICPRFDPEREVRFALVMYGGVSLAIYMNGISQEFLRLVRASAPPMTRENGKLGDGKAALLADSQLRSTEEIYRRLAQMTGPGGSWDPRRVGARSPEATIRSRFVIDIISGTSAGGINGVFLAKAVATAASLENLAALWVDEGDIHKLINDKQSAFDKHGVAELPTSLLNSRRMYSKLLDAFEGMDDDARRHHPGDDDLPRSAALGHEVDLFVTTTDIVGIPVALRLADGVVPEERHRNVFHLRFSDDPQPMPCNDFTKEWNPLLAFISRCTSSFPFAFEPMTLADVDAALAHRGRGGDGSARSRAADWQRFFPAYTGARESAGGQNDPGALAVESRGATPWLRYGEPDLTNRAFGDGGYLDNKPFEYAIGALSSRRGQLPTERKLVFVEPSPEHPELLVVSDARPNVVENVSAALSLARQETIRGDLARVLERNRLVERVNRIVRGIDQDLASRDESDRRSAREPHDPQTYAELDLGDMIAVYGIAYGGYHRLKVSALTDEIAEYVSCAAGFNEKSDEFQAIRHIVGAWRGKRFAPYRDQGTPASGNRRQSENVFALHYDVNYRIRRLQFLLTRIDTMVGASSPEDLDAMLTRRRLALAPEDEARATFEDRLRECRVPLAVCLGRLRRLRLDLLARSAEANPIAAAAAKLPIGRGELLRVLSPADGDGRVKAAAELIEKLGLDARLDELAAALEKAIAQETKKAAAICGDLLPAPPIDLPPPADGAAVAHAILRWYYWDYERYDQLIFPAFFSTDVGDEASTVDVLRVSPEDAPSLLDERRLGESRRKLAGNALMHFGAFLDRRWRWNDILWGRLDGAERLITLLMPGRDGERAVARQQMIDEAHGIILEDELRKPEAEPFHWATGTERELIASLLRLPATASAEERGALREAVRRVFSQRYTAPPPPPAHQSLRAAARATRVVGQMLDRLSEEYSALNKPAVWLTRIGSIVWGLVEVAVPNSIMRLSAGYWFKVLYAFEAVTVALGLLLDKSVRDFGLRALGVTAVLHVAVLLLSDAFLKRSSWLKRIGAVAILGLAATLSAGAFTLVSPPVREALLRGVRGTGGGQIIRALLLGVGITTAVVGLIYLELRRRSQAFLAGEIRKRSKVTEPTGRVV